MTRNGIFLCALVLFCFIGLVACAANPLAKLPVKMDTPAPPAIPKQKDPCADPANKTQSILCVGYEVGKVDEYEALCSTLTDDIFPEQEWVHRAKGKGAWTFEKINISESDYCYYQLADFYTRHIDEKGLPVCGKIGNTELRDTCYLEFAVRFEDPSLCEWITAEEITEYCGLIIEWGPSEG